MGRGSDTRSEVITLFVDGYPTLSVYKSEYTGVAMTCIGGIPLGTTHSKTFFGIAGDWISE